jgi:hypothetical protein
LSLKLRKIIISFIVIAYLSSLSVIGIATTIATDGTNDVGKVSFTNGVWASYTIESRPELDIVSIDYVKDSSGNVTFTVTFAAAPVIDIRHWYAFNLGVDDGVEGFLALITAGSASGSDFDDLEAGFVSVIDDSTADTFLYSAYFSSSEIVSGNSLVFTLQTKSDLSGPDYVYPDNPSDNGWVVSATAIYGEDLSITSTGDLYVDYYPDSDNLYDLNDNGGTSDGSSSDDNSGGVTSSPGFESAFTIFSIAFGAIVY